MRGIVAGLVGAISLTYLMAYELTPLIASGNWYYFWPIVMWSALAIGIYYLYHKTYGSNILRWRFSFITISNAAFFAVVQIFVFVLIGIAVGFGKNVMGSTPVAIALNAMLLASNVFALEMGRAYLLKLLPKKHIGAGVMLISLFFAIMLIPTTQFAVSDAVKVVEFVGIYFLVALAQSIFATGLALIGGPTSALAYILTILGFMWLFPVLPNPSWAIKSLLFTIAPIVGFISVYVLTSPYKLLSLGVISRREMVSRAFKKEEGYGTWIVILTIFTLFVWFQSGAFGVQPAVIVSGSMSPSIEVGDIVITSLIEPSQVAVGDVISYRLAELPAPVVHRVVNLDVSAGTIIATTQGDALSSPDSPVVLMRGAVSKVIYIVPKIGWVSIYSYQAAFALAGYLNNVAAIGAIIICAVVGSFLVLMRKGSLRTRR
jgi:signal peptidase